MTRTDLGLAAALIALASFAGLRWAGASSSNVASWVQAFGTIGAVIGAAMIARWQFADLDNRRRAERQSKASVTAYLLVPRYISLLKQLQDLGRLRDWHAFGTTFMRELPAGQLLERLQISAGIPSKFEFEIHCFDPLTAMSIAQTIAFTDEYNRQLAEALPHLYASRGLGTSQFVTTMTYNLQLIEKAADQAWRGLAKYHRNELAVMERL